MKEWKVWLDLKKMGNGPKLYKNVLDLRINEKFKKIKKIDESIKYS